jgi:hypothetical protein
MLSMNDLQEIQVAKHKVGNKTGWIVVAKDGEYVSMNMISKGDAFCALADGVVSMWKVGGNLRTFVPKGWLMKLKEEG